ncbi:hypothetical protein JOQ06_004463, partial [Pogonophryne albipinna]
MEVCSVVSDMEEGGDNEDVESDGEEVEMTGPLEGKIFNGETNAVIRIKRWRKDGRKRQEEMQSVSQNKYRMNTITYITRNGDNFLLQ